MHQPRLAFLLLAALWLGVLVSGHAVVTRDIGATHLPWREEWARQVRNGWLPLWNPRANGGRPLWADPNAQAAYPASLLFLVFPATQAMVLFLAVHHLWAIAGLAWLARRNGVTAETALTSALVLGTGGVVLSLTTFPNALASFSWLPWATGLLFPAKPKTPLTASRGLAAGALLGVSFLAGEPVTAGLGLVLGAALLVTQRQRVAMLGIWLFGFVAVALPLLLPLLTVLPDTVRGTLGVTPQALAADTLAPRRFLELFFPRVLGTPLGDAASGFWAAPSFPWQRYYPLVFFGPATAFLVVAGARRGGLGRFWLLAFLAGLMAAVLPAWPPAAEAIHRIPGGTLVRFAVKALQVATLAAVPLVARGLEGVQVRTKRRSWPWAAAALLCLLPALVPESTRGLVAQLYPASAANLAAVPRPTWQRWLLLDGLTNAGPLLALGATRSLSLASWAFLAAHLPLFSTTHVIVLEQEWVRPPDAIQALPRGTAVACFVQSPGLAPSPSQRTFAFRNALVPDYGMTYGLSYVLARGPDGLEPIRGELLAAYGDTLPPEHQLPLAGSLGAQAVILPKAVAGAPCQAGEHFFLCRPPYAAPDAYLVRRVFPAQTLEQAAAWLAATSFAPGHDAVLASTLTPETSDGGVVVEASGPPHHRRFRVQAANRTFLVVNQNYLTSWRAAVDGAPAPVVPANFARVAVPVPAGTHRVELWLEPTPYLLGLVGPLAFAFTWIALQSAGRRGASGVAGRSTPARGPVP